MPRRCAIAKYKPVVRVSITLILSSADLQPFIDLVAERFPDTYLEPAVVKSDRVPDVTSLDRAAADRLTLAVAYRVAADSLTKSDPAGLTKSERDSLADPDLA